MVYLLLELESTIHENKWSTLCSIFVQQIVTSYSNTLAFSKDELEKAKICKPDPNNPGSFLSRTAAGVNKSLYNSEIHHLLSLKYCLDIHRKPGRAPREIETIPRQALIALQQPGPDNHPKHKPVLVDPWR